MGRIEFQADDLPKTSTLKVQRGRLKARYTQPAGAPAPAAREKETRARAPAAVDGMDRDLFAEVCRAVAEAAQAPGGITPEEITPNMKLQLDLAIDSIGRVDLLQKLELQLGLTIPQDAEGKLFTVRDVVSAVRLPDRRVFQSGRHLANHG